MVECRVGQPGEFGEGQPLVDRDRTDARGDLSVAGVLVGGNRAAQGFQFAGGIRARQQADELIAAPAGSELRGGNDLADGRGYTAKRLVTDVVTVGIVHLLEVVEIHEEQGVIFLLLVQGLESMQESGPVRHAGERVGYGPVQQTGDDIVCKQ